jgi:hypothetical protein
MGMRMSALVTMRVIRMTMLVRVTGHRGDLSLTFLREAT